MTWFYLSFVDRARTEGDRFLGGCYLDAVDPQGALILSHVLRINPGGEVCVFEMTSDAEGSIPPKDRCRLLSRAEIEAEG